MEATPQVLQGICELLLSSLQFSVELFPAACRFASSHVVNIGSISDGVYSGHSYFVGQNDDEVGTTSFAEFVMKLADLDSLIEMFLKVY
jgi:hypothetical protein